MRDRVVRRQYELSWSTSGWEDEYKDAEGNFLKALHVNLSSPGHSVLVAGLCVVTES